jgi:dynein heavy chain
VGAGLLSVSAAFSGADLQVTPSLASVLKTLTGVTRGLVEAARVFPRWMFDHKQGCGTSVVISEDEDAVVVSFYDDVIKSPVVVRLMLELNHLVHRTSSDAGAWLDTWRAFDAEEGLWSSKRSATLEKARKQAPSVVFYDAKLAQYAALVHDAAARPASAQCGFLRVDGRALAAEVVEVAGGWKQDYAALLHDSARALLEGIEAKLAKQRRECLGTETSDLDALKAVLNAVASIEAE